MHISETICMYITNKPYNDDYKKYIENKQWPGSVWPSESPHVGHHLSSLWRHGRKCLHTSSAFILAAHSAPCAPCALTPMMSSHDVIRPTWGVRLEVLGRLWLNTQWQQGDKRRTMRDLWLCVTFLWPPTVNKQLKHLELHLTFSRVCTVCQVSLSHTRSDLTEE